MALTRHFFTSHDLDDLERMEEELETAGVLTSQIHLLTLDDSGADTHRNLHQVSSLMKKDIVHSALIGALIGMVLACILLVVPSVMGWTEGPAGWIPWIFLALVALGFCTWEGGLWGIQTPNAQFREFEERIGRGEHVFFVDIDKEHLPLMMEIVRRHPKLNAAGTGQATPSWIVFGQHRFRKIFVETLP